MTLNKTTSEINSYNEELGKTEMAMEIERKIRQRGLTHQQAAEILGIDEDQLSSLLRIKLAAFSSEQLMNFCDNLGKGRTQFPEKNPAPT